MSGWWTATIVAQNLPTDANESWALVTGKTLAPYKVVDVSRHGKESLVIQPFVSAPTSNIVSQ